MTDQTSQSQALQMPQIQTATSLLTGAVQENPLTPQAPAAPMTPSQPQSVPPLTQSSEISAPALPMISQEATGDPATSTASMPLASNVPTTAPSVVPTSTIASSTTDASSNSAYEAIIAQQQAQIEALTGQNSALNAQVVHMIQGGAQLASAQPQAQQATQPSPQVQQMLQMGAQPDPLGQLNTPSLSNPQDFSLESLASEIGKPKE